MGGGRLGRVLASIAVVMALAAPAAWSQEAELARAAQLMKEGKPAEAFALLEPLEGSHAGEIRYDYLLGTAALDAGEHDRAVIAFERVLLVDPNFAGARLDLARTYFAMGADDFARNELDAIMKLDPPANVREIVSRYVAAIEQRSKKARPSLRAYLEAGGGADSNVSAVTSNFQGGVLQAYNIPNVQPTGNSLRRQAMYTHVGAGLDYVRPFEDHPAFSLYAGGDVRERHFHNNAVFDYQQFDARGGLGYTLEKDAFRLGWQGGRYYQEGAAPPGPDGSINNDRRSWGYTLEWRRTLSASSQLSAFAQLNEQRFSTNNAQDINQKLYGVQYLRAFEARWKPVGMVMGFLSRDRALRPLNALGTTDASKTLTGFRVYGQITPRESFDVFVTSSYTERSDDSQFSRSTVLAYGKDGTADLALGVNWRFRQAWTARLQASATESRSNISLFEYTRNEVSLNLRRDFQ